MDMKLVLTFCEGTGSTQNWYRCTVGTVVLFEDYEEYLKTWQKQLCKAALAGTSEGLNRVANGISS